MESKALNREDVSSGLIHRVFRLCPQIEIEGFKDGALLLRLKDRHLFELNPTAYYILRQTDGHRSVSQVAHGLIEEYQISETEALQDVLSLYTQFSAQGVVEAIEQAHKRIRAVEETSAASPRYIRNPDVVLQDDDSEGGLLINPNTRQVRALNSTGMFIWQQCDGTHSMDEIMIAVQDAFESVPTDQMTQEVREFIKDMVESGFIGTMEVEGEGF